MNSIIHMVASVAAVALLAGGCVTARQSRFDSAAEAQASIAAAVDLFREQIPATGAFFDDAYGYAVFPGLARGAAGIGGVMGRGVLVEQGEAVGDVHVWQIIHGITFGGEMHREIIFFKDAATLEEFKRGTLEWRGRAGVAVGPWGGAASPSYVEGVAVFAMSRLGLMVDASVAAASYSFAPIREAGAEGASAEGVAVRSTSGSAGNSRRP